MSQQSSMHYYLNWAKERIDEMDAALASFEVKAGQAKAESKVKTDQLLSDLTQRRDEFQALLKAKAKEGEAAWADAKAELERHWNGFEAQMKTYFESAGQAARAAADHVQGSCRCTGQGLGRSRGENPRGRRQEHCCPHRGHRRRAPANEVRRLRSRSTPAEAEAGGSESWSVMSAALAESRKAFDQANKAAWEALKGANTKS